MSYLSLKVLKESIVYFVAQTNDSGVHVKNDAGNLDQHIRVAVVWDLPY